MARLLALNGRVGWLGISDGAGAFLGCNVSMARGLRLARNGFVGKRYLLPWLTAKPVDSASDSRFGTWAFNILPLRTRDERVVAPPFQRQTRISMGSLIVHPCDFDRCVVFNIRRSKGVSLVSPIEPD